MSRNIPIYMALNSLDRAFNKLNYDSVDSMKKAIAARKKIESSIIQLHDNFENDFNNDWYVGDSLPIQNLLCSLLIDSFKIKDSSSRKILNDMISALPSQGNDRISSFIKSSFEYLSVYEKNNSKLKSAQMASNIVYREIHQYAKSSNLKNILSLIKNQALIQEGISRKITDVNERESNLEICSHIKKIVDGLSRLDNERSFRNNSKEYDSKIHKLERILTVSNLIDHNAKTNNLIDQEMVKPILDVLIGSDLDRLKNSFEDLKVARIEIFKEIDSDLLTDYETKKEREKFIDSLCNIAATEIKSLIKETEFEVDPYEPSL